MFDAPHPGSVVDGYFGIFAKLRALSLLDSRTPTIYEAGLAEFYDHVIGAQVADVGVLQRVMNVPPSTRILDLACGSGRVGMPLAEAGHHVDGLEISHDMLRLAEQKRSALPADVAARLTFRHGDMTRFELSERYGVVLIGATSISLLLEAEQRQGLFQCVKRHLEPDGKFVFDIVDLRGERWERIHNYLDVWTHESDTGEEFAIVGQVIVPGTRRFTFNVYREFVDWSGTTQRAIGTSTKVRLDPDELRQELSQAGLTIVSETETDHAIVIVASHV